MGPGKNEYPVIRMENIILKLKRKALPGPCKTGRLPLNERLP